MFIAQVAVASQYVKHQIIALYKIFCVQNVMNSLNSKVKMENQQERWLMMVHIKP